MIFTDDGPESSSPRVIHSADRKISFIEKVVVERKLPILDQKNSDVGSLKGKSANIQRELTFPEEVLHQPQTLLVIDTVSENKRRNSPPRPPTSSTPSRATSARPKTRIATPSAPSSSAANGAANVTASHANMHHSKQSSLENRILIRLAGILPSEDDRGAPLTADGEAPHHSDPTHNINFEKLSESRNTLLKLNQELDEIMYDVRSWGMEIDRFNFGIAAPTVPNPPLVTIPTSDSSNPQDNQNAIVFDQVIADLSQQAGKKVNRIKNSYRKHYHKIKQQHETETSELRILGEQLSSRLYQMEMDGKLTAPLKSAELNQQQHEGGTSATATEKVEVDDEHSRAVKYHEKLLRSMRLEQEDMQQVFLDRLEHERKVALDKVAQLTQQLHLSQQELAVSNERAQQMAKQLIEKDTTLFDRERIAVNSLKDTLKAILNAQPKQKSMSLSESAQERTANLISSITDSANSIES